LDYETEIDGKVTDFWRSFVSFLAEEKHNHEVGGISLLLSN